MSISTSAPLTLTSSLSPIATAHSLVLLLPSSSSPSFSLTSLSSPLSCPSTASPLTRPSSLRPFSSGTPPSTSHHLPPLVPSPSSISPLSHGQKHRSSLLIPSPSSLPPPLAEQSSYLFTFRQKFERNRKMSSISTLPLLRCLSSVLPYTAHGPPMMRTSGLDFYPPSSEDSLLDLPAQWNQHSRLESLTGSSSHLSSVSLSEAEVDMDDGDHPSPFLAHSDSSPGSLDFDSFPPTHVQVPRSGRNYNPCFIREESPTPLPFKYRPIHSIPIQSQRASLAVGEEDAAYFDNNQRSSGQVEQAEEVSIFEGGAVPNYIRSPEPRYHVSSAPVHHPKSVPSSTMIRSRALVYGHAVSKKQPSSARKQKKKTAEMFLKPACSRPLFTSPPVSAPSQNSELTRPVYYMKSMLHELQQQQQQQQQHGQECAGVVCSPSFSSPSHAPHSDAPAPAGATVISQSHFQYHPSSGSSSFCTSNINAGSYGAQGQLHEDPFISTSLHTGALPDSPASFGHSFSSSLKNGNNSHLINSAPINALEEHEQQKKSDGMKIKRETCEVRVTSFTRKRRHVHSDDSNSNSDSEDDGSCVPHLSSKERYTALHTHGLSALVGTAGSQLEGVEEEPHATASASSTEKTSLLSKKERNKESAKQYRQRRKEYTEKTQAENRDLLSHLQRKEIALAESQAEAVLLRERIAVLTALLSSRTSIPDSSSSSASAVFSMDESSRSNQVQNVSFQFIDSTLSTDHASNTAGNVTVPSSRYSHQLAPQNINTNLAALTQAAKLHSNADPKSTFLLAVLSLFTLFAHPLAHPHVDPASSRSLAQTQLEQPRLNAPVCGLDLNTLATTATSRLAIESTHKYVNNPKRRSHLAALYNTEENLGRTMLQKKSAVVQPVLHNWLLSVGGDEPSLQILREMSYEPLVQACGVETADEVLRTLLQKLKSPKKDTTPARKRTRK